MFIVRVETKLGRKLYRRFATQNEMLGFISGFVADYEDDYASSQFATFKADLIEGNIEFGMAEVVELDIENRVSFEIVAT
jgi:hypothetical protein